MDQLNLKKLILFLRGIVPMIGSNDIVTYERAEIWQEKASIHYQKCQHLHLKELCHFLVANKIYNCRRCACDFHENTSILLYSIQLFCRICKTRVVQYDDIYVVYRWNDYDFISIVESMQVKFIQKTKERPRFIIEQFFK